MRALPLTAGLMTMMVGCSPRPVVSGPTYDLWLFAGQSNDIGAGLTQVLPPELQVPQPGVPYIYKIYLTIPGAIPDEASLWTTLRPRGTAAGPQVTFGATMTTLGHRVAIAQFDISGAGLANGNWQNSPPFPETRVKEMFDFLDWTVAAATFPTNIKGLLWNQGETDASSSRPEWWPVYRTNFESQIVGPFRAKYGANLPIITTELNINSVSAGTSTIRAQQVAWAAADVNGHLVNIDDVPVKADGVHWTSSVLDGQRAAAIADGL